MPTVSFGKMIAPFKGIEIRQKLSCVRFGAHQARLRVKQMAVIQTSLVKPIDLLLRPPKCPGQLSDGKVIESIFQGSGNILVDADIEIGIASCRDRVCQYV